MFRSTTLSAADLLEAAPDAMVVVDAKGRIALVNAQVERLFGYLRDELVGEPVEVLVPQSSRAVHPGQRARYLDDPRPRPMGHGQPLAARRKDGTEFPAEISLSAIDTDEGRLVVTAVRDVSAQRRAAQVAARLAWIVESSDEAIIGKTPEGVITSWNAAAQRIYGYRPEEIIGHAAQELFPPDLREQEAQILARTARGERIGRHRTRRMRADGSTVTVSTSLSPVIDSSGTIIGVASVSRDLTEQEIADAKFHALLDAAPDGIVGVDRRGCIVLVNALTERLIGYSRQELIGQPVEILVPERYRSTHPTQRDRYLADPRPRPMGGGRQLSVRRKDGTEFPADISLNAVETEDGRLVISAIRDATARLEAQAERDRLREQAARERMEAQLHQAQRLESLGQLAGGVAHDFNNLLGVIANYTAFVEEELTAAITAGEEERWGPAHRDVGQISKAVQRAVALTHQLLTFGRREVVRPRVLDLNEVVRDVEALLRRTLGEHIRLEVRRGDRLWAVRADPGQIEQVLMNLAVNSRHAMPGGGTLAIETSNVVVDALYAEGEPGLRPGRYVDLVVSDSGVGMAPEVVSHAFEPFFTTKPKGEGTGLGLATVYGIVTQADGHIHIQSAEGVGTTVRVLLPATDEEPTAEPEPEAQTLVGGGETVLVVEDEDALREVTQRILERNGYRVLTASRGRAALELTGREACELDLLLTDVIMPQMLGKEVADRIRERCPDIKVLYMSGYARPVLAEQGTLDPGVELVGKPFSEAALLAAVREALDADPPGAAP